MKKNLLFTVLVLILTIGLTACGSSEEDNSVLSEKEVKSMLTNADDFKGRTVKDLPVEIFNIISEEDGNYQYQAWTDADAGNAVIITSTTDLKLKESDYALISGTVSGMEEYETMIGKDRAPLIKDATATKADSSVFNATNKTLEINKTITQEGIEVTLNKIEFADASTRVYFTVKNGSSDAISIYSFDSFILQGSTQFDESDNSYEENTLKDELKAGVNNEGCLSFEKMEDLKTPFDVTLDVSSDNFDIELEPFTFNITP